MACSMRLNDGLRPYNPCIIREGKKRRRTRIAWPWASSLIPQCVAFETCHAETRMDMCIYTHARFVATLVARERRRRRRREIGGEIKRRRKERKKKGKEKKKRRNKRDANSLLHREHGHDVKAKEGMRYIRAIRSPRLLNVNALGRFLEFRRKIDDP